MLRRAPAERPIEIRRVRPSDWMKLREFYALLSPDSRRARFLGSGAGLSDAQSLSFCTPDHVHGEGLVALAGERLVGHLCLEPCDAEQLELAVAVSDDCQGRGVGRRLFEAALSWASRGGFRSIVATAYADNARVLRLLSSAPHGAVIRGPDAGVVTVDVPLVQPLPQPWRKVAGRKQAQRRSGTPAAPAARRRCRVVWRRRRPPERAAAD
jgi:GNAT superfamily N-acetyltransferase